MSFLISLISWGILYALYEGFLPIKISRVLLLIMILPCLGISVYLIFAMFQNLLAGRFLFSLALVTVLCLFAALGLKFFQDFKELGVPRNKQRRPSKFFVLVPQVCMLICFAAFLGLLISDYLISKKNDIPLWRQIGLFLFAFLGLIGQGISLKHKLQDNS